jgi:hypothetical protein
MYTFMYKPTIAPSILIYTDEEAIVFVFSLQINVICK